MFAGLAVNWVLPWLHITDQPLSLTPLLICFNVTLSIFGIIAYKRNKYISLILRFPKLDRLNKKFFITSVIFPILSILGAITLNNGGSNYLTMIMLGGIVIYIILIVFFRNKLNECVYPWSILFISLSLLLSWWLRSWYVSGVDTNVEYHIFQVIKENKYWSMSLFQGAYNACLSISVLPTVYSLYLKINDEYIFKLIIPVIFSIVPVVVYLFLKKYTKGIFAFLAAFFFVSQPDFPSGAGVPIRQEIALIFFALVLLALFNRVVRPMPRNVLLLTFLFSMVISHYSTTYIALALFVFTFLACLFFRKTENKKYFSNVYEKLCLKKRGVREKRKYYLSGTIVAFFIVFSFIWYTQVTKISNDLVNFTDETVQNMGNIFSGDVRAEQTSPFDQFNIFYKQEDPNLLLQDYLKEITSEYRNIPSINLYPQEKLNDYSVELAPSDTVSLKNNSILTSTVYYYDALIQKLVKIFIIIGAFYMLFWELKKREIDIEYVSLVIFSILGLIAVMTLPFASIVYDLTRTYQQLLVLLSLPAVFGTLILFKFINKNVSVIFISVIFLSYFLSFSGFTTLITGGTNELMQLTNNNDGYDELYTHESEVRSANWLLSNEDAQDYIYADERGWYKLWLSNYDNENGVDGSVFPSTLDTHAYVYSSYTNTLEKKAYIYTRGVLITYKFPTTFLNINKNIIYNNGESIIFK
ncbi:MAG: DUF2206 domain-containing protein [Candidatus Microgenomates bacterium]|jgi:uncharacterized membrane protein